MEEPAPLPSENPTALGKLRMLESIEDLLVGFRGDYINHISSKLASIARWCGNRGTNIIVFPEYSVPVETLPIIKEAALRFNALIIAGTHRVRLSESSLNVYKSIGLTLSDKLNGAAICPLLFPNGKVNFSIKQSKSKWEPNLNVNLQDEVPTHNLIVDGTELTIAVAPCIDSIQMTTLAPFWASKGIRPNILICPSLSPPSDAFKSVGALMAANETLMAVCNCSNFGGTSFNIPDNWNQYLQNSSAGGQSIPRGNEAILEIDVDPKSFHLKKGSVITKSPCGLPKEFLIEYDFGNPWLGKYNEITNDIIELLKENSAPDAIGWVDSSLSDQSISFPQEIVSRLKEVRHNQLVLYSGDLELIKDALKLAVIEGVERTDVLLSTRINNALQRLTTILVGLDNPEHIQIALEVFKTLKSEQSTFSISATKLTSLPVSIDYETKLSEFRYIPSDSILAAFQNRGDDINTLRDIMSRGSEKVILLTGMSGIGKTELVKTFFLKVLADWKTVWVNVPEGSSVARLVSDLGGRLGIVMDPDSLSTVTDAVFRQRVSVIFNTLFSLQRFAIIVDDLMSLRRNGRDYHQLQTMIEVASKVELFKGSRLFLLSSVSSPPLWLQRAGIARVPIHGLIEKHIRRIIEFQLRASGALIDEESPDIPQRIFDIVGGHPLSAKVISEATKNLGLNSIDVSEITSTVLPKLLEILLPKVELSEEERISLAFLAVLRLPVDKDLVESFVPRGRLDALRMKAILDYDGQTYSMHPLVRDYFARQMTEEIQKVSHKQAVAYYDTMDRSIRLRYDRGALLAETIHHLALAGEINRLNEIRASSFDELFSSARTLYVSRYYDRALHLFKCIGELRPNDPAIWAYIGRCFGRKQQWSDCDSAFRKAIKLAEKLKQDTWWLHRDWAHIQLRYSHNKDDIRFNEGKKHLDDAKKAGGEKDPSVMAAEAYLLWQEKQPDEAKKLFEAILKIAPDQTYTLTEYQHMLRVLGDEVSLKRADELRVHFEELNQEMAPIPTYAPEAEEDEF